MTKFVCSQCRGTHVLDERFINTNLFAGYYCLDCKMWVKVMPSNLNVSAKNEDNK